MEYRGGGGGLMNESQQSRPRERTDQTQQQTCFVSGYLVSKYFDNPTMGRQKIDIDINKIDHDWNT